MSNTVIKESVCGIINSIIDEKDDSIKMGSFEQCTSDSECSPDLCDTGRKKCVKYIKYDNRAYPIDIFIKRMVQFDTDRTIRLKYMLTTLNMTNCTSQINIIYGVKKSVELYKEDLSSFYHKYSNEKGCVGFSVIYVRIQTPEVSHANVILVENVKDFLVWNYYEPHGYDKKTNTSHMTAIEKIGKKCALTVKKMFILNHKKGAQCPIGVQSFFKDYESGYCQIFSYFWIWCVLNVIKRMTSYISSNQWISYVEKCVVDRIKSDPILVYKRVISFAYELYNNTKPSVEGIHEKTQESISSGQYEKRVLIPDIGKNSGKYGEQFAPYSVDNNSKDEVSDISESPHSDNDDESALMKILENDKSFNIRDKDALITASIKGYLPVVRYLVENNADEHALNSAFSMAVDHGHLHIVQYLIENGVNIRLKENAHALVYASLHGFLPIVEYLVDNGIDADFDEPMRVAATEGHLSVIQYLQKNGANIHANEDDVLLSASRKGHLSIVRYIVERGVPNLVLDKALKLASRGGYLPIVKYLVEKGAEMNAIDDALKLSVDRMGKDEEEDDYNAMSEDDHLSVVKYLEEKGANIYAINLSTINMYPKIQTYLRSRIKKW